MKFSVDDCHHTSSCHAPSFGTGQHMGSNHRPSDQKVFLSRIGTDAQKRKSYNFPVEKRAGGLAIPRKTAQTWLPAACPDCLSSMRRARLRSSRPGENMLCTPLAAPRARSAAPGGRMALAAPHSAPQAAREWGPVVLASAWQVAAWVLGCAREHDWASAEPFGSSAPRLPARGRSDHACCHARIPE